MTLLGQTLNVIVPSGALAGAGTVAVTLYAPSAAPKTIKSSVRRPRGVGADAALVAEFSVTVTGTTLLKPLQASVGTIAAVAGSIFRLAGYGTHFDDVDTVTYNGTTATSDLNVAWPRMSLASNTLYAFYTEPQAEAGTPAPVVTVGTNASGPIGMFGTATFTASEADANGFPYLDPSFTFSLDTAALGTINASSGAFTAGAVDATGHVVATDTTAGRGSPHGSGAVSVSSQRPGYAGDTFAFTGTLSSTTQQTNSNITTQPQTDAATITLNANVDPSFTASTGGGQNLVHSTEVDTYPLRTITTKTDSRYLYAASGASATFAIVSSDAKDSNGAEYVNAYGSGNGLLDVLPETAGAFGPNDAALTYTENDPAGFTRQRTTAAAGSYTEIDGDALGDAQTISQNGDLSGTYDATQYTGFKFVVGAPSGSSPKITMQIYRNGTLSSTISITSWIPAGTTQPSAETDTETLGVAFPASCGVPSKYGTSGNQTVQTIKRVDAPLGDAETETTTTYVAPGVGPVCVQMTDATNTYYDYTRQNGNFGVYYSNAQPVQTTSISETLTLQSASTQGGTSTKSALRSSSSFAPSALAPVVLVRARFERVVRDRLAALRANAAQSSGAQPR
ncbi:MAG TPA: hypothetical protein VK669_09315 [Candidatus Limnocylindrales bacterium]|nr:hypothetical protein [Candidatus Limnocylindrales bacterium]